jgi:hypothetical protein
MSRPCRERDCPCLARAGSSVCAAHDALPRPVREPPPPVPVPQTLPLDDDAPAARLTPQAPA